ncbi:MAG: YkgJ family cysteine cluster protein, partial [Candidatus Micrarchaeota archaeon]
MNCLRCGKCCTQFGVCITPFDLLRLQEATGKPASAFVSLVVDRQERERKEPAILIDGSYWLLTLARDAKEVCCFYTGKGCSVYGDRPILCRCYPFVWRGKLKPLKSRACIAIWNPNEKEAKEYEQDAKQYAKEIRAYRIIAKEWNKRGG